MLLVGAGGAVGAALQCMLQREGAVTLSCRWKASQLQTKVSDLLFARCPGVILHPHRLPCAAVPKGETRHCSRGWHWGTETCW